MRVLSVSWPHLWGNETFSSLSSRFLLLWRVIIRAAGQMGKVIIAAVAPKSTYFDRVELTQSEIRIWMCMDASISGKEQCMEQESGGMGGMFERVQSRTWRLTAAMSAAESKFSGFIACRVCMVFQDGHYMHRRRRRRRVRQVGKNTTRNSAFKACPSSKL